jgi:O-methyltransferase
MRSSSKRSVLRDVTVVGRPAREERFMTLRVQDAIVRPQWLATTLRYLFRYLQRVGALLGFRIVPMTSENYWADPRADLFARVQSRTYLNRERLQVLAELVKLAGNVAGDAAEAGVFRGGSARLIRECLKPVDGATRTLFLFDTFAGMPQVGSADLHMAGDFAKTSARSVETYLADLSGVVLVPGLFSETLPGLSDRHFSFVHVDCDIEQSARECVEFFAPRMNKGGVMLFDDYGGAYTPGMALAIDGYFDARNVPVVWLPSGQAFVVAP